MRRFSFCSFFILFAPFWVWGQPQFPVLRKDALILIDLPLSIGIFVNRYVQLDDKVQPEEFSQFLKAYTNDTTLLHFFEYVRAENLHKELSISIIGFIPSPPAIMLPSRTLGLIEKFSPKSLKTIGKSIMSFYESQDRTLLSLISEVGELTDLEKKLIKIDLGVSKEYALSTAQREVIIAEILNKITTERYQKVYIVPSGNSSNSGLFKSSLFANKIITPIFHSKNPQRDILAQDEYLYGYNLLKRHPYLRNISSKGLEK